MLITFENIHANGVCRYFIDSAANNRYTCELQVQLIDNEVLRITGTHLSSYSDDDVIAVRAFNSSIPILDSTIVNKFRNINFLNMDSSNVQRIMTDAFAATNLSILFLPNNPLRVLRSVSFPPTLTFLSLASSELESINENTFDGLGNLVTLNLNGNPLTQLPRNIFQPLINLENLFLSSCRLTHLDREVFNNNLNLRSLVLVNNQLEELPEGLFTPLSRLSFWLSLNMNRIRRINANSFGVHQDVRYFSLSLNQLDEIEPGFFQRVFPNVTEFDAIQNVCVNRNLVRSETDFDNKEDLAECRRNWENPRTTTTSTTITTTPITTSTTDGGSKLQGMTTFSFVIIVIFVFLIN